MTMETIDEYEIDQPREPFTVDSDDKAEWAMRKLSAICAKIDENWAMLEKEKLRWQAWIDQANGSLEREASFFRELLLDYMRRERENRKSIKLPHGTLKSVASTSVEVDEAFVEWALQNDREDLLTIPPPKPNKAAIKKEDGLPHVEVVERVSYSVELK